MATTKTRTVTKYENEEERMMRGSRFGVWFVWAFPPLSLVVVRKPRW